MRTALLFAALAAAGLAQNVDALERRAEQLFEQQKWPEASRAAEAALRADPKNVNALVILGLIATREAKPADASRHFERASVLRPGDARITAYLASAYFQQGRIGEAEPLFRRVVSADPGNYAARFNFALLLLQRGAPRDAEVQFEAVAKANPQDVAAAAGILECRLMENNQAAASQSASQINARLAAGNPERLRIAALLAKYRRWDLAIPVLKPVPAASPHGLEARYDLALAHFRSADNDAAASVLAGTPGLLQQPDAQHLLGNVEEKRGHLEAAREALNRAAALAPTSEDIRFDQAVFELEHGSPASAVTAFRAGVDAFPNSPRMRLGLGDAQYLNGSARDAVETLLELVRRYPGVRPAYSLLGGLYDQVPALQDQIYDALNAYVNGAPRDPQTLTVFAKVLDTRAKASGKRDERSATLLRRALELDPKLTEAYVELAAIESDRGDFEKSRELLERATRLSPAAPEPHYHLARIYRKLGRTGDAAAESKLFRDLQQKSASAEKALAIPLKEASGVAAR